MNDGSTRRQFLGTTSGALAGLAFGLPVRFLSASELNTRAPVYALFPGQRDPALLQHLAQRAIGAAMDAGASFADIRLIERRLFSINVFHSGVRGRMGFDYSYGLRVCVGGRWGMGYGVDPTPEGIVNAAQTTVAQINTLPGLSEQNQPMLASAPVVTGEWSTPVIVDPFTVSPEDHVAMAAALGNAVNRVRGAAGNINFDWHGETKVVATSDGTLVTQFLVKAMPSLQPGWIAPRDPVVFRDGRPEWDTGMMLGAASAGFEITEGPALQEEFKHVAEETVRLASYPTVAHYPVGRYEVVLDGYSAGALLGGALMPALSADRLLGQMRHREGDSFLRPLHEQLDQPLCSPLVNVTANRAVPCLGAARWDDEGVPTRNFSVITDGNVTGVFGTRATMAQFPPAVQETLDTTPLAGSAVAPRSSRMPTGSASAVRLAASTGRESLDDLFAGMERGVAILGGVSLSLEPNLGFGLVQSQNCFEVKDGRLTRQILGAGMQFSTRKAWQNIAALGGPATVQSSLAIAYAGAPAVLSPIQVAAPAVQFSEVGIVDLEASLGGGQ